MTDIKTELKYFTTFKDEVGKTHYAVHSYSKTTGITTSFRDLVFSSSKYN